MNRIDELQKKYPNVPRQIIIKLDALTHGVRDSSALDKVGHWARSGGVGTYQTYDRDITLKEMAERNAAEQRPGYVKRLGSFHMDNGLGVRIERDSTSPYEIRELDGGQFALCEGDGKVEDVYFPHIPWPFEEREAPMTGKGTPVTSLVSLKSPNCFFIVPVRHCEYFTHGEQCKFCNYNATQEDARAIGALRSATTNLEEMVEAYKILSSTVRFVEGSFQIGAIRNSEQEAKVVFDFVEKIASAASYTPCLHAGIQPMDRKTQQRLRDAGLETIGFCREVWDPQLFAEVCPGKAKHRGHERYLQAFFEAVDVFGTGNVSGVFVGCVTLMPPNGHKTWQESRDSMIEGMRWMAKNGVFPVFLSLRLGTGSVYGNDKSNREKLAPTEFYLDAAVAHDEAMKAHGLYAKMNKFMYCPLDCFDNHYSGDIGVLELAGDPARWIADIVPDKANWLARFVSSVAAQSRK